MRIKIIKEKKFDNITFVGDRLNLSEYDDRREQSKKDKSKPDYRLRESGKVGKLKKSRVAGGHGMQGHSPVYE
jgi:hypothetical protein